MKEENVSLSVGVNLPWSPAQQSKKPRGPVWKYFLEEKRDNTPSWICQFCGFIYNYKHATRLQKHLLRCSKASAEAKQIIEEKLKSATSKRRKLDCILQKCSHSKRKDDEDEDYETDDFGSDDNRRSVSSRLPALYDMESEDGVCENSTDFDDAVVRNTRASSACSTPRSSTSFAESQENDALRQYLESVSSKEQRTLDKLFARAVYSSDIAFHTISENAEWRAFFKRLRPSFKLPHRQQLCTTLLNSEYARLRAQIDEKLKQCNVLCLQSDGWSNRRDAAILNFIITTPKPVFYKTVETKYERHTVNYFFKEFENIILHVGQDKFQACITDNASAMVKSTAQINKKYPHITSYTCAAHSISLLVQDILKLSSVESVTRDCSNIVRSVNRSHVLKSSFLDIQEKESGDGKVLGLQPPTAASSKTFWKESFECLLSNARALRTLCIGERTKRFLKTDVRTCILDEDFWTKVKTVHEVIATAVNWIVLLEGDASCISAVFHAFHQIEETMKRKLNDSRVQRVFGAADAAKIVNILAERKKILRPIHYASYLLDPQYRGRNLGADEDVCAMEFVDAKIRETFSSADDIGRALDELSNYKCQDGFFKKPFVADSAKVTAPLVWWKGTCTSTKLKSVAEKILSLPATIALTERSFSVQRFIQNIKRNRLKAEMARKVTFINYNLHLAKPKSSSSPPSRALRPPSSPVDLEVSDDAGWELFITEEEVDGYDDDNNDNDDGGDYGDGDDDDDEDDVNEYTALFEIEEIILGGGNDNERTDD